MKEKYSRSISRSIPEGRCSLGNYGVDEAERVVWVGNGCQGILNIDLIQNRDQSELETDTQDRIAAGNGLVTCEWQQTIGKILVDLEVSNNRCTAGNYGFDLNTNTFGCATSVGLNSN